MLELKNITKDYVAGSTQVRALRGVTLKFRESEFVAILGPSGCGKTTLLNIVGGLDRFTDGDLVINGKSTKDFRDGDWDAYRNNSVGFVFQTYNLIPHQSVIANVELALTLSGVSKSERTERAKRVLERVGLGDQMHKKPNQLSGGQMQRVAIARALINDPDVLLADEPTGALDSETSLQIMELLREIADGKLVIMVTHNPDLADRYSTRIIRLLDGLVTSDSNPVESKGDAESGFKMKRTSMSFVTALSLSVANLLTKKARTLLTAFAGSIGIIGIALIMSLSNGMQTYISNVERDTLSSYPITIQDESVDLGGLISSMQDSAGGQTVNGETPVPRPLDRVYTNNLMARVMNTMLSQVKTNDLKEFKSYIEENRAEIDEYTTAIKYSYSVPLNLYAVKEDGSLYQVNPSTVMDQMSGGMQSSMSTSAFTTSYDMWAEMIPNDEFLESQYEVIAGDMPDAYDEAVLIVSERNSIPDTLLYALGLKNQADFDAIIRAMTEGTPIDDTNSEYAYKEILSLEFALILPTDLYEKEDGVWADRFGDEEFMRTAAENAEKIKIVGILRPNPDAAAVSSETFIGYTSALTTHIIDAVNDSEIVREQNADVTRDVLTGLPFVEEDEEFFKSMDDIRAYIETLPEERQAEMNSAFEQMETYGLSEEQILAYANNSVPKTNASYAGNQKLFGVQDADRPTTIDIYASSFENKDLVAAFISRYNEGREEGTEITYTDYIGLLLSSITSVINAISAILIAFVSISLVVSSIMIGIITYISVLERTREIGVLRAIGASKRDISNVFNAETLFIGFAAGVLGIAVTLLLCFPANAIILRLTEIPNLALLPVNGGVALVIISMVLTFIAGLIPSRVAARKDPVVALRTE